MSCNDDLVMTDIDDEIVLINIVGSELSTITDPIIDSENNSKLMFFDVLQYIKDIAESYENNFDKINKQFIVDFSRQEIYVNDVKQSLNDFYNFINNFETSGLFIMLVNQSSFYLPYVYVDQMKTDSSLHIVNTNKPKQIYFNKQDEDHLHFMIKLNLNAINPDKNKVVNTINITLSIIFNLDNLACKHIGTMFYTIS
jgi:hypothetical protein